MQTEDHPIEYNQFEGVIPEGEYGGGTVMIWDRGTWEPEVEDVDAALRQRRSQVQAARQKAARLMGAGQNARRQWLLIKHRDKAASYEDIAAAKPRSAVSRRTLAGIARRAGASAQAARPGGGSRQIRFAAMGGSCPPSGQSPARAGPELPALTNPNAFFNTAAVKQGRVIKDQPLTRCASSRYRHNALANFICRGVEQSGTNRCGLATRITAH